MTCVAKTTFVLFLGPGFRVSSVEVRAFLNNCTVEFVKSSKIDLYKTSRTKAFCVGGTHAGWVGLAWPRYYQLLTAIDGFWQIMYLFFRMQSTGTMSFTTIANTNYPEDIHWFSLKLMILLSYGHLAFEASQPGHTAITWPRARKKTKHKKSKN